MKSHAEIATERLERAARLARSVTARKSTPERIHDLRGSCRRAIAVLDAYELDSHAAARARKLIEKFLRRAGQSRDATVAVELLRRAASEGVIARAQLKQLVSEQRSIRDKADARIRAKERPARELRRLLAKLARQVRRAHPLRAGTALRDPIKLVRRRIPRSLTDPDALHKLRLALKRLRFAAELCGSITEPLAEHAHALTDRLGAIQDLRILSEWLAESAHRRHSPEDRRDFERSVASFRRWASQRRAKALGTLRRDLAGLLREAAGCIAKADGAGEARSRTTKRLKQKPNSSGSFHRRK